jgi:hypothetical protein
MPDASHGNYGQVPPPELQFTPGTQLAAPPPVQETSHVAPLQLTDNAPEFLPEQRTTLVAAVVLSTPAQERLLPQVMAHWLPEQFTGNVQLSTPPRVIWVLAATLDTWTLPHAP